MQERIFKTLIQRYTHELEDSLLKIDLLCENPNATIVQHTDITGEIDKLLKKAAAANETMAILRRFYGNN